MQAALSQHPNSNKYNEHTTVFGFNSVLSDPSKRMIYDLLGEEALLTEWDVGLRLKTADEIRDEYELKKKLADEIDRQKLVNSKGKITVTLDATSLVADFDTPEVKQANVQHSWETKIGDKSSLILSGNVLVQNGIGKGTVTATVKHAWSSVLWGESALSIGDDPSLDLKLVNNFTPQVFAIAGSSLKSFDYPPIFNLTLGRHLNENTLGMITYNTGIFSIGPWQTSYSPNSSCTLSLVRNLKESNWNLSISAGDMSSQLSISYNRNLLADLEAQTELALSTHAGWTLGISTLRKIDQNTKLGIGLNLSQSMGVSWRFKISRLGQVFSVPIIISPDIDSKVLTVGVVTPLIFGLALDYWVLSKIRARQRKEYHVITQETIKTSQRKQRIIRSTKA
jgi:DnaJ family protein C protein 11